jgi:hypothetical protein
MAARMSSAGAGVAGTAAIFAGVAAIEALAAVRRAEAIAR